MSIVALVPARSGSSRVPNKNVRELHGVPLAAWTLFQALSLPSVDRVILSSDSAEYDRQLRWAVQSRFEIAPDWRFVEREPRYSGATATLFSYVVDAWRTDFSMNTDDLLVSLLPTAPLRRRRTVQKSLDLAIKSKRGVFTAAPYNFPVSFAFTADSLGNWQPLDSSSPMVTGNTRSQDQVTALHPNGGVTSMWGRDLHLRPPSFYTRSLCVEATLTESFDIDTEEDWQHLSRNFEHLWDQGWGA